MSQQFCRINNTYDIPYDRMMELIHRRPGQNHKHRHLFLEKDLSIDELDEYRALYEPLIGQPVTSIECFFSDGTSYIFPSIYQFISAHRVNIGFRGYPSKVISSLTFNTEEIEEEDE